MESKEIRLLNKNEIECRVATCTKKGVSLLLYKTARVDRALLDEVFGQMNWQNDFKVIDGKMYGGIGIYDAEKSQWLWRWDCGVESNTEAEKGQASDCFKRAGFKWGIGVELYSSPFIWVKAEALGDKLEDNGGRFKCSEKFEVDNIEYKDREISALVIVNSKKEIVYTYGKQSPKQSSPKVEKKITHTSKVEPMPEELDMTYKRTISYLGKNPTLSSEDKGRLNQLITTIEAYDLSKANEIKSLLSNLK